MEGLIVLDADTQVHDAIPFRERKVERNKAFRHTKRIVQECVPKIDKARIIFKGPRIFCAPFGREKLDSFCKSLERALPQRTLGGEVAVLDSAVKGRSIHVAFGFLMGLVSQDFVLIAVSSCLRILFDVVRDHAKWTAGWRETREARQDENRYRFQGREDPRLGADVRVIGEACGVGAGLQHNVGAGL
jgi:hypothetical protein